jgi:hypothetical protein
VSETIGREPCQLRWLGPRVYLSQRRRLQDTAAHPRRTFWLWRSSCLHHAECEVHGAEAWGRSRRAAEYQLFGDGAECAYAGQMEWTSIAPVFGSRYVPADALALYVGEGLWLRRYPNQDLGVLVGVEQRVDAAVLVWCRNVDEPIRFPADEEVELCTLRYDLLDAATAAARLVRVAGVDDHLADRAPSDR